MPPTRNFHQTFKEEFMLVIHKFLWNRRQWNIFQLILWSLLSIIQTRQIYGKERELLLSCDYSYKSSQTILANQILKHIASILCHNQVTFILRSQGWINTQTSNFSYLILYHRKWTKSTLSSSKTQKNIG